MRVEQLHRMIPILEKEVAKGQVPGVCVSVIHKGEEVFSYQSGFADLENGIPMTGEEYLNIYSCSKVTTVTAAAQLQTDFTHGWRLYRLPVRRSPTASEAHHAGTGIKFNFNRQKGLGFRSKRREPRPFSPPGRAAARRTHRAQNCECSQNENGAPGRLIPQKGDAHI